MILAALGAGIGAVLRLAVTNYGKAHWERVAGQFLNFPLPTLFINLTGAFLLGIIYGLGLKTQTYSFLATGILGGYTTFSTLNTELLTLSDNKNWSGWLSYLILSYGLGLLLVYLGYLLGKLF